MNARNLSHLDPEATKLLDLDPASKIAGLKRFEFVPTADAVAALQWLSYFRRTEVARDRPRGEHIVGLPGTGKSRVLRHYFEQMNGPVSDERGVLRREVILGELPESGEVGRLRQVIITACLPGSDPNASYSTPDVVEALHIVGVKQILLDEAGNLLNTGKASAQRSLAQIKHLINLGYTVAIATTDRLRTVLAADDALSSRFHVNELSEWREDEFMRKFIAGIERQIPFPQPSHLDSEPIIHWLIGAKVTRTGRLLDLIRDASYAAFLHEEPRLTLHRLMEAWETPYPPDGGLRAQ